MKIWACSNTLSSIQLCIWGDCIYITGYEEEGTLLKMYCVDRKNGAIKWQKDISVDKFEATHSVSSPANATPASDGDRVVFYFSSYGLLCYDLNGEIQWEMKMPIPESRHGMGTSPVISGNLVILNCFGHLNDPCLLALNKYSGEVVWKNSWELEEGQWVDSYSTPVIYKDQVIIYRSADVSAYDLGTGDQIWRFSADLGDAISTPVIGNDIVFISMYSTFSNTETLTQFPDFPEFAMKYDTDRDSLISEKEMEAFEYVLYPEKGIEVSGIIKAVEWFWWFDHNKDSYVDGKEWGDMNSN